MCFPILHPQDPRVRDNTPLRVAYLWKTADVYQYLRHFAGMQHAKAYYHAPSGLVDVKWERVGEKVELTLTYPTKSNGFVCAPCGYTVNGEAKVRAASGTFVFEIQK